MANTVVKTFDYTGGTQTFTMPAGYHPQVDLYMWGAGGGGGGSDGNGPGGNGTGGWYWAGTITINKNDVVQVAVGGGGGAGGSGSGTGAGSGGRGVTNISIDGTAYSFGGARGGNAGPAGWSGGGGGGGAATVVVINGSTKYVAAGGGGGGGGSHNRTGNPGYTINSPSNGTQGTNGQDCNGDGAGGGGGGGGLVGGFGGTMGYDNSSGGYGGYTGTSTPGGLQPIGTTPDGTTNPYWSSPIGVGTLTGLSGNSGRAVFVFRVSTFGGVKVGGEWKGLEAASVKVGGEWRPIQNAWTKKNGVWKLLTGFSAAPIVPTFASNYGPATPELGYPAGAPQGDPGGSYDGGGISGGDTGDGGGGGGGGGGGCFLTTATVHAMGLPDDCEELTLARLVRDTQMTTGKNRVAVDLYYKIAPVIVERKTEWGNFYNDVVAPVTEMAKNGRYEDAIKLYKIETVRLIDQYATNYSDRETVEHIFGLVSKKASVPYFVKYSCVKLYFMLKLLKAKWKIKNGVLRK